jgi:hypothetical protein
VWQSGRTATLHPHHLLDDAASVDLEAIEIDARGDLSVRVQILAVPVGRVLLARQCDVLERLAAGDVSRPSLQHRHRDELREQVVDPQRDPIRPGRVRTRRRVADRERDAGLRVERVGIVLTEAEPGVALAGWRSSWSTLLGRRGTWHERAEDEHRGECCPSELHVPSPNLTK